MNTIYFVYQGTNLLSAIDEALKHTISFSPPILSKINTLDLCIELCFKHLLAMFYDADPFAGESPLLFLTNNHTTFEELFKQQETYVLNVYKNDFSCDAYNPYMKQMTNIIRQNIGVIPISV